MSEAKLCRSHGKWVAIYGGMTKAFETMKDAAKWLEEQQEKERKNGRSD